MAWIIYADGKTTYDLTIDGVQFEEKFMYLENAQFKPYITVKIIPDSNVNVPDWYNNQNRKGSWFNSYMVSHNGLKSIFVEKGVGNVSDYIPYTYISDYNALTQDSPFYRKGYYIYYTYREKASIAYLSPGYNTTSNTGFIRYALYDKYDSINGYAAYGKYAGSTEVGYKFIMPVYLMYSNKTSKDIGYGTQLIGDISKYGKVTFVEATLIYKDSITNDCVYKCDINLSSAANATVNGNESSISGLTQKYKDLYYGICKQQIMHHDTLVYTKVNNSNIKIQSENMKIKMNNAFKPMDRMWVKTNNIWKDVVNNSDEAIRPPSMQNQV